MDKPPHESRPGSAPTSDAALAPTAALTCQRAEFSLPDDLVYLNTAYMGPLPNRARLAAERALAARACPDRIGPDAFFAPAERAREACAALVNANPEQVALVSSTAQGVAIAVANLSLPAGGTIVVPGEQFPSNVLGWQKLSERGLTLKTVPRPAAGEARAHGLSVAALWNARLLEAVNLQCAVLALEPGHWTDGLRFDLPALAARAREVGAALVIDATQFVGACPIDVDELQPDLLVAHAYKSMLSHYGLGFAVFGPRLLNGRPLEEHWMMRRHAENFAGLVDYQPAYAPGARRYDSNVRANNILVASLAASAGLLAEWQPARVAAWCQGIAAAWDERFRDLGFGLAAAEERMPNLYGLQAPSGKDPETLRQALQARNIQVSIRGSSLRLSLHAFNRSEDLGALVDALAAV